MAKCKRVLRCHRCGKILQSVNPKIVGYTNPKILEEGEKNPSMIIYCDECHDALIEINNSKLNEEVDEQIIKILDDAVASDGVIIWVVDLFSFNGVVKERLANKVKKLDVHVVGTKRDLFPKTIKDSVFVQYLKERFNELGIDPVTITVLGNENPERYAELIERMQKARQAHDVYMIGASTSGKTSLINRCLKHYQNKTKRPIRTITYPKTDCKVLEIPLSNSTFLYELPGISNDTSVVGKVEKDVQRILIPKKGIQTPNFLVDDKSSIVIGGLGVFSFISCKPTKVKLYVADEVEFKKIQSTKVRDFMINNLHKRSLRPVSERYDNFQLYDIFQYTMEDDGLSHDISIEGLGWISFIAKGQVIRVILPKGTAVKESLSKVR